MENHEIVLNGRKFYVEEGHSYDEWEEKYSVGVYWDFSADDILLGAIEPPEGMTYWYIDGRFYECSC